MKYKVAVLFICTHPNYWQYAKDAIEGARKFLLPEHDKDFFLWTDMPENTHYGATVVPTEAAEWPFPTLMRYHLFLQMEEKLKDYDYIFYSDIDMRYVDFVGNEILGDGITAAQHPMYAVRRQLIPPYEPNPASTCYIPRPGRIIKEVYQDGTSKSMFEPLYYAGGFQGGKSADFIKAWKVMKRNIDTDFDNNYTAIWNDESHWNRYLFDNPPAVVLSPSYIYPDSMIDEYYVKVWGCNYPPKIVTLTKKFTTSKEAGDEARKIAQTL